MPFEELVQIAAKPSKRNKDLGERGCAACPLNRVKGVVKIMGSFAGRKILVVGQSPGPNENKEGREFVGDSGEFLWTELEKVGIRRDECDVTNVVRCFPADLVEGSYHEFLKMRNPTAQEIHCCSIHTETMMRQSKAEHILILGQVAQKAFLETRSVPKQRIFWSEKFKAKIYLADHPAFFVRGYGAGARLEAFRSTLKQLASGWKGGEIVDDFAYLRQQKYFLISTAKRAAWAGRFINKCAARGRMVSVDIEYDKIDGREFIFAVGFCPRPGLSFTYVFDCPGVPDQSKYDAKVCREWVKALVQNPKVKKVFHYGCSDVTMLEKAGIAVQGYVWDTNYSEYLYYPEEKSFGLETIAERRFQQFSGYKGIIFDDLAAYAPEGVKVPAVVRNAAVKKKVEWLKKYDLYHLSNLKPDTLRLYNGGDADLTKRVQVDTQKKVPPALVRLYIDLGFMLKRMEDNGPWFDVWQSRQVGRLFPYLEREALAKLREMAGNPEFNPASPPQVYEMIYETLGLVYPLRKGKPNTRKQTLLMLGREHPFPPAVVEWRKLSKATSTYIEGPLECSKRFGGRVKTVWWASGTESGRLSSSGGDEGGMNLQNLHNDPRLLNQYVSDQRWRQVFNAITQILKTHHRLEWESAIERWIRENMPDLKTFLVLDYGQIEVRVAAMLSGDENLIADCAKGDIHTAVGVTMTGWAAEKIKHDKKTRTLTKNVHFGILFGIDKRNLFEFIKAVDPTFDGTEEMVFEAYDRYFARYKKVQLFIDHQREIAEEQGYVETIFGLHRTLNIVGFRGAFDEQDEFVDEAGERKTCWRNQCINTPVQGTAHQLLVCGMVNIIRRPEKYQVLGVPCMDVHDALYMMVNVLDLQEAYRKSRYLLEKESLATVKSDFPHIDWTVPIVVEAEAGLRLGGKVELENDSFTTGGFMLEWYQKTKTQILELRKQLDEVPEEA